MSIKQLPPKQDLEYVASRPFVLTVTATGAVLNTPTFTIKTAAGDAWSTDPGQPTVSINGAGTVITVVFDAADTAAQNTSTRAKSYQYALSSLVGSDGPFDLMGGTITVRPVGSTGTSNAASATLTFTVGVTAVDLAVTIGASSDGSALLAHTTDPTDAHDASAISYAGGTGLSATDVEAALDELATEKVNTTDLTAYSQINVAPLTETATSRTASSTENGKVVRCTAAGLVTITLPTDASNDLPDGFWAAYVSEGAAGLTVSTTGLTVPTSTKKTIAQSQTIVVFKTAAANTWVLIGGTST
jgi:hypothetical protein